MIQGDTDLHIYKLQSWNYSKILHIKYRQWYKKTIQDVGIRVGLGRGWVKGRGIGVGGHLITFLFIFCFYKSSCSNSFHSMSTNWLKKIGSYLKGNFRDTNYSCFLQIFEKNHEKFSDAKKKVAKKKVAKKKVSQHFSTR